RGWLWRVGGAFSGQGCSTGLYSLGNDSAFSVGQSELQSALAAARAGGSDSMKVFLSYGHDQNAPLVDRIRRDLKSSGHEAWIDKSEIKTGQEWRRSIVDGLSDTDWMLAFL